MLKTLFAAAAIGALSLTAYSAQDAFAAQDMAKVAKRNTGKLDDRHRLVQAGCL